MENTLFYQEDLLHFLWKKHKIPKIGLKTTQGEDIEILTVGLHNDHDGPDFLNARIRIGQEIWVGPVEIHLKSSDWYAHKHEGDPRYDAVVLHVVGKHNREVYINNRQLPCLEIGQFVGLKNLQNYKKLKENNAEISCLPYIFDSVQEEFFWMRDQLLNRRFQRKISEVLQPQMDSSSLFYTLILAAMGAKTNKEAFLEFGKKIPWIQLNRWSNQERRILEYLMYLSGLFSDHQYEPSNFVVFQALKIEPMRSESWYFKGIRPQNNPKKRLLDFFEWIRDGKFQRMIEADNAFDFSDSWNDALEELRLAEPKPSNFVLKNVAINAIAPFAYFRGTQSGESAWFDLAFGLLDEWTPENNKLTKSFSPMRLKMNNAGDSQALLELYASKCKPKKCLTCALGTRLMSA